MRRDKSAMKSPVSKVFLAVSRWLHPGSTRAPPRLAPRCGIGSNLERRPAGPGGQRAEVVDTVVLLRRRGCPAPGPGATLADHRAGAAARHRVRGWRQHQAAGSALRQQGVPDALLDEAIRLYNDGSSCQRLAERYDCDAETVRQTLKRAGVKLRAPWERA